MSAEAEVTEALNKPIDQNAEAAEDAKKMLAELQGGTDGQDSAAADGEQAENDADKDTTRKFSGSRGRGGRDNFKGRRDGGQRSFRGRGGNSRGRSRGGYTSNRDNIKSDLTTQELSDDPVAIRKQVEFYFSDSNLPMDKFLFGKVGGSKNNPVEIAVIHSFKRMRHFQPVEAIVSALKESTMLELVDDDTAVRRKEPLPETSNEEFDPNAVKVFEDRAMPRTVYVKGFGEELPSTQFDIEAFFAPYGPTNAIRLRRADTKVFKGSVFVEFENEELAQKFLELDPKPQYNGKDLQIMSKKTYCDQKVEDIKSGKIRPNTDRHSGRRGGRSDHRNGRDQKRKRDDEDDRDWRERRDEDRRGRFKDDRRRSGRDRNARGGGTRRDEPETDERGVPVIKPSADSKKDTARAEALAKARAAVESDNKKAEQSAAENLESADQNGLDAKKETGEAVAQSIQADAEAVSKKRTREEDENGGDERAAKKTDLKPGTES